MKFVLVHHSRCPGRLFPLAEMRRWATQQLTIERDRAFEAAIHRQYRPD